MVQKRLPSTAGQSMEPDNERRALFVAAFFETGNASKSAVLAGVHLNSAMKWKNQAWFDKAIKDLKKQKDRQMDGRITNTLEKLLIQIEDRIDKGDDKLFMTKDGEVIHKRQKVSLRDLTISSGVLFDKRAAIRREPDSDDSASSALDRIADKLREYARTENPNSLKDVVDVEVTEVPEVRNEGQQT